MEIEVVRQVNSRFRDGRTFSAMPGRRVTVDDSDNDAVAHMKALVVAGDAVEIKAPPRRSKKDDPDTANKVLKPVEVKPAGEPAPVPTNEELREELRDRGLAVSGNKDELTDRLAEDDDEGREGGER